MVRDPDGTRRLPSSGTIRSSPVDRVDSALTKKFPPKRVAPEERIFAIRNTTSIPPFNLDAAVDHLSRKDRTLGSLIRKVGPCELAIATRQSPYQALAESIVYQQLTGKAAATIFARVCKLFNSRGCPSPAKISGASIELLRSAGLSRSKAAALKDLAAKVAAGDIPTRRAAEKLSDDELVERLTSVRGVGRWTVEMFLIFTLGRPDVLPLDDYGVRKGSARAYGREVLPGPRSSPCKERWRPYRTAASWYLWRATELES
ncbi:MAG: DNA-3-methyladenine glycosylase 2 family protein [Thermoanaerobaculia bacterium]